MRFDADRHGALALGLEGGHSRRRVVHAGGSATGRRITRELSALAATARARSRCSSRVAAGALLGARRPLRRAGGACAGGGEPRAVPRAGDVLATGGMAALWARTHQPAGRRRAPACSLAHAAGAELADLEFMQFHPTALVTGGRRDGFLITEAIRGEGATLLDADGERFVDELAPRDQVALAVEARAASRSGRRAVGLDMRAVDLARFPNIAAALAERGHRPAPRPVPVAPAAHYTMGGVATDLDGRSTLPGLYAVGECACTGLHGANRLASNSLAECFVFGRRAALAALDEPVPRAPVAGRVRRNAEAPPLPASRDARRALAPRRARARRRGPARAARRPVPARAPDRRGLPGARGEPRRAPAPRPPGDRPGAGRHASRWSAGRRAAASSAGMT